MYGDGVENQLLIERAFRAWLGYRPYPRPPTPSLEQTTVETYDGRVYIVMRAAGVVVDVYRLTNEKQLRLLSRNWPGPYGRQARQYKRAVAA